MAEISSCSRPGKWQGDAEIDMNGLIEGRDFLLQYGRGKKDNNITCRVIRSRLLRARE